MKHTMKKFSRGGAQGMYDRRMADIEKDYQNAMKRKTGRAAEVAAAKRDQRKADAEDDRAKRMGLDRTKTREAERNAEYNLTRTRRSGAAMPSVTKDELIAPGKMTESLGPITVPKSGLSTPAKKAPVKVAGKPKPSAADIKRNKFFQDSLAKSNFKAVGDAANARQKAKIGASNAPSDQGFSRKSKVLGTSTKAPTTTTSTTSTGKGGVNSGRSPGILSGASFGELGGYRGRGNISVQPREARQTSSSNNAATDATRAARLATLKKAAEAPGATGFAKDRYKRAVSSGMYAKGGQIMKKKPMPMGGKQLMPLRKKLTKEPITGGSDTVPATSERNEFRKEMMKRNATPGMSKGGKMKKYAAGGLTKQMPSSKAMGSLGMAKGGKAKMKPAAKGKGKGNPFAATKFGAAMMKKSADTKGRAMPKFAKGGSIDGCAVKGKTKAKRVTMKKGGSC